MVTTTRHPTFVPGKVKSNSEKTVEELLPGLKLVNDVAKEELKFVWYPYIPAGKVVIIEGDPGLGKSWIACDIASRLSTGAPFPGELETGRIPQKTLILSAEDGIGETIRPRLEALGADLSMIYADDEPFTLTDDSMDRLEQVMARITATITFIDPIVGYMGGRIDMHRANEVRALMSRLQLAARRTGSSVVAVRHLRKGEVSNKKYSGIGSIDFTAAVRSQMQVGETKSGRTYMEHVKHNLTPKGPTLAYTVEDGKFIWQGGMDWKEEEKKAVSTTPRRRVPEFLAEVLLNGPIPATEVIAEARRRGISEASLMKGKADIAYSKKINNTWVWDLKERRDAPHSIHTMEVVDNIEVDNGKA